VLLDGSSVTVAPLGSRAPSTPTAVRIVKLDVDANPATAQRYGITSIPAMKVFRGREVVTTVIDAKPKRALESDLADFLA